MADWELRAAVAADVEAVAELRAVVLRADLERLGRYDERRVRQRLRDGFAPAHTWVVEADGGFAGCVALRPGADGLRLEHFYLDPRLQGGGIGAAVLRRLLSRCDRDGVPVRLNVLQGSPARRLYERHGFTVESEDPVDVFMVRLPLPAAAHGGRPAGGPAALRGTGPERAASFRPKARSSTSSPKAPGDPA
ncbi:GNAT family N-acetyltransferase [Streptomyces sp900105245]|uniref:GNAT family N-acetyltransferase n=1 Tax=Streptomyces sp. 900105245 TaxID=3154379 RepID=UPI0033288AFA